MAWKPKTTCGHNQTEMFRVPGVGVKELCTSRMCWKNVRGRGVLVPEREARKHKNIHVLWAGETANLQTEAE